MAMTQKRPAPQTLSKERRRPYQITGLIIRGNPVRKAVKPCREVAHEEVAPRM